VECKEVAVKKERKAIVCSEKIHRHNQICSHLLFYPPKRISLLYTPTAPKSIQILFKSSAMTTG
jgi:hypothetical protein